MIAPDDELVDRGDRLARLGRELRQRAVVIEAQHRGKVLLRQPRSGLHRDIPIRIGGIADDQHFDAAARHRVHRLALLDENPCVLQQQVLALHARSARPRAYQQRELGFLERGSRVAGAGHAGEQRKRAILELHHHALERRLRLVDGQLEQLQDHRLVLAEHVAVGDAEQQAVADLAGGAGHRDADGLFHRELQDDDRVGKPRRPGTQRARRRAPRVLPPAKNSTGSTRRCQLTLM